MARAGQPLFLARESYRRRRAGDAARLLPLVGGVLLLLPILWSDTARTASGLVYVFFVWFLLIIVAAILSRALKKNVPERGNPEDMDA